MDKNRNMIRNGGHYANGSKKRETYEFDIWLYGGNNTDIPMQNSSLYMTWGNESKPTEKFKYAKTYSYNRYNHNNKYTLTA